MTDEERKVIKIELAFTDELVEFVKKYSNKNLAEDVRQTVCHFWDSRFPSMKSADKMDSLQEEVDELAESIELARAEERKKIAEDLWYFKSTYPEIAAAEQKVIDVLRDRILSRCNKKPFHDPIVKLSVDMRTDYGASPTDIAITVNKLIDAVNELRAKGTT
jgi:hypothetical protein